MYEYKIVNIERHKEQKTREVEIKRGKTETQVYMEVEIFEEFLARAEKILNDFARDGWQVININYSLPIQGNKELVGIELHCYSTTDFNSAEFVAVLQRNK